jgi:hypothetical protein
MPKRRPRHASSLPRKRQVLDGNRLIAPWPRGTLRADDEQRLAVVIEQAARIEAYALVWMWPDRDPVPVGPVAPNWVVHWQQGKAVYGID